MTTKVATADLLDIGPIYTRASTGKRFLNYLIDLISFYAFFFLLAMVVAILSPDSLPLLENRIFIIVLYALYMSLVELIFRGKSLGKLITQTRALNLDGSRISAQQAFGRGFSRAVPFCAFSAFGDPSNPWQDKWTDTMVVDEKLTVNA